MKRFHLLSFLLALACSNVMALSTDTVALQMTTLSVGRELAADDPAVARTRAMLEQVSKLSGDDATAIFAACQRYSGHLHDAAQIRATPLELLAALATAGAGTPVNDTLRAYVAARKAVPGKTHAETMALLAKPK